jgi:hypothetical protein
MFDFGSAFTADRIKKFIDSTKDKEYNTKEEFNSLFEDIRKLIFEYIEYYDKKRKTKQRQAIVFKFLIAIITFAGVAFPVLDIFVGNGSLLGIKSDNFAEIGHALLIIAAILYGVKSYYGSTNGHIRYAKTQLKLEELISIYTVEQSQALASADAILTDKDKKSFYKASAELLIKSFKEILGETDQWGKDVLNDEKNFIGKYVDAKDEKEENKKDGE